MSDLTQIHDHFFKAMFERSVTALNFLVNYLPQAITRLLDLTTIEVVKGSFVDEELQERFSDLVYRVKMRSGGDAYVYVLFEHKSAPDKWVAFQLLRYMLRIWERATPGKHGKLPPIFPIVLYHGKTKWKIVKAFAGLIELEDAEQLVRYVPNFEY
ncbi:MAG TPA: Rpn family recombination-promoting nuclease/putative transposase, partial [Blastocatellia bacterium]